MLKRVLVDGLTLSQLYSQRIDVALPAYRYRFRQALHRWVTRPSPQIIPRGPLVLLADGLWFEFDGVPWVLYLTALKSCSRSEATFLDPLLLPGREGATRWQLQLCHFHLLLKLQAQRGQQKILTHPQIVTSNAQRLVCQSGVEPKRN